jgi:murein DD-endopeptidase MepM/ murein hydrolase activator NlpD
MYLHDLKFRECDAQGCGYYKAPRGSRTHNGRDLAASVGTPIELGFSSTVVKVGWAYSDPKKSQLRYIAFKIGVYYCRVFYISPTVSVGDEIKPTDTIGHTLNLGEFYAGITEHTHVEFYKLIDDKKGEHSKRNFVYCDPDLTLEILKA